MSKYINKVKKHEFDQAIKLFPDSYKDLKVLDLGSGKGQDLFKFQHAHTAWFVDSDGYALAELRDRASKLETNI